jgi:amino acid permease
MIVLVKGAVGAGVLNLPFVVKESGLILGSIFILSSAVITYYTMNWLAEGCTKTGTDNYGDLVTKVLGEKAGIFLNLVFIINAFGALPIYMMIFGSSIPKIMEKCGMSEEMAFSK